MRLRERRTASGARFALADGAKATIAGVEWVESRKEPWPEGWDVKLSSLLSKARRAPI